MTTPIVKIHQKGTMLAKTIWSALQYRISPNKYFPAFFHDINNIGDQLTPYIVKSLLGKPTINVSSINAPRIMAVGSILHYCSEETIVWGTGIISSDLHCGNILPENIFALRGKLTLEIIEQTLRQRVDCAVGDPGVLMPSIYCPNNKTPKVEVGLIPHYVDEKKAKRIVSALPNELRRLVRVISVRQGPESFIDELYSCNSIFSSSLHGLILADAYGIPNKWVELSKNIIGDGFKFHDYYSFTNATIPQSPLQVTTPEILSKLLKQHTSLTQVHYYAANTSELRDTFFKAVNKLQQSINTGVRR